MRNPSPGHFRASNLIALLVVLGSILSAILQIESILLRWQVVLFLAFFMGLQISLPATDDSIISRRKSSLILVFQTLIVVYLVLRTGISFPFLVLFFILSMNAARYFSLRWVLLWITGFILVTAVLSVLGGGWEQLLLETAVFAAGYLFFGIITNALRTAQLAQSENERLYKQQTYLVDQQKGLLDHQVLLLDELKQKNIKLQEYAQQVETLAVVEERNRLSREMHDTLGHRLTTSAVQLEAALRLLPEQSERASNIIAEVRQEVRHALAELRQTVGRLREPVETEMDLEQALVRMVDKFKLASDLEVNLDLPDEPCLVTPAQRLALFRAAQEGLTNIQRHSQATEARLRLICTPAEVRLVLQDDGRGLPTGGLVSTSGFGLRGLKERADALGGEVVLKNSSDGGAELSVCLPRSNV